MNRRRFLSLAGTSIAGVALVGCGSKEANPEVVVTKIPNVAGAPPTLAPNATPPNTSGATSGGAAPATGGGASTFSLEAHDPFNWSTKKFTIEAGGTITVKNTGVLPHDFSVDALKIAQPLASGKTYEVKVPADAKPGDYEYYCNVPGHKEAGMFGTMTVAAKGAGGGQAPQQAGGQGGGAATFSLEAHDPFNWSTKKFTIEAGGTVTVTNKGVLPHDFSVDALKIAQPLASGKTFEVKIPADAKPGDYEYYCNVPGHKEAGMFGTMTVVAKGAGGAAQQPAGGAATQAPAQSEATPPPASGPAASPVATPAGGTMNVAIQAGDNFFKPNAFTIPGNTNVIITITNIGQVPHDFVIDQLKIQSKLVGPGESTTVKVNAPAGKYEYYCAQPGHKEAGMYGTMTVEGGPAGAAASPVASPAASPAASPVAGGGATSVTLEAKELVFIPNKFTIPAETDVTVTIKNIGVLPHDFVIDKLKVKSALIQPGKETTVTIKAAAGQYEFYCAEPGHKAAGMFGTMTVK